MVNAIACTIELWIHFSPWARNLKKAIWYQNEGQIPTPIFNNFDCSRLFWCMITMPNE